MNEKRPTHRNPKQRHSYLLRLWRTDSLGSSNWQASLEDPHTGQRIGFASLEQLFGFLMDLSESDGSVQRSSVER